ncbi:MAG TPA: hypothetical protein VMW25_00120 [Clostridia bacterium]|nr:hypothetical protein [Clostridia bacterium]
MKKSWGLLLKILSGKKTAESRWFKTKHVPWNQVRVGDTLWFKNTGEPVTIKARVSRVVQFEGLNTKKINQILSQYGKSDLGLSDPTPPEVEAYFENKRYCILVFFDSVQAVKPFNITKKGFGAMAAWICVDDIQKIKLPLQTP